MLLKQPGTIGPLRLKNRVIMAPMGTNYGTTDGFATDRDKRYYAERARGGVAMIVTEAMNVSAGARNHTNSLCVFHDRFIPGLSALVRAIHDHGALAVAQLNHRGQLLRRSVLGMEPVGPTAGTNPATGEPVRALRLDEIRRIEDEFVEAARRIARAGYDAVELHAANGYLFHQFFSPRFNSRSDEYGGSRERRMRLLLETVGRMHDDVPDLPVLVRLSATEYVDGGYTEDDIIALARALEAIGVVAIDLSGGSNESPQLSRYCIQPPSFPRRCLEPYARPIKQALSIPVIIAGRILTPDDAEGVLNAGSADFISLGRAMLADPHWCAKAFGEIDAPIRACISCNVCLERLTLERDVACIQNPLVGTEFETLEHLEPQLAPSVDAEGRRRVLVLGAGVAGAEAARVAASLGHTVEIWEQSLTVGGQTSLALAAPYKEDVAGVWTYREAALKRLAVPIRVSVQVTAEAVRAYGPDVIVVATGARPKQLMFEPPVSVPVFQAWDVLLNPDLVATGSTVTIVGGGMVGIETADALAIRGCEVTVIELQTLVAREMARNNRSDVLDRLRDRQVRLLTGAAIEGVTGGAIVVRQGDARIFVAPGDAVIVAIGPEPNRDLVPLLDEIGIPYVLVGDCNQPGDFLTAIRDASMAAFAISQRMPVTMEGMRPDVVRR
jgi:2,4-dienoyl-CoA reductase-like NADH-dependent reductase (Old Yellow Enzyme family)/thioredoxin reductase